MSLVANYEDTSSEDEEIVVSSKDAMISHVEKPSSLQKEDVKEVVPKPPNPTTSMKRNSFHMALVPSKITEALEKGYASDEEDVWSTRRKRKLLKIDQQKNKMIKKATTPPQAVHVHAPIPDSTHQNINDDDDDVVGPYVSCHEVPSLQDQHIPHDLQESHVPRDRRSMERAFQQGNFTDINDLPEIHAPEKGWVPKKMDEHDAETRVSAHLWKNATLGEGEMASLNMPSRYKIFIIE